MSQIAAAPARVVNTASNAHVGRTLDFDDLQLAANYRTMTAYGCSKLANILFTRELARHVPPESSDPEEPETSSGP